MARKIPRTLLYDEEKDKEDLEGSKWIPPGLVLKAELYQIPEILELIFSYLDPWTVRTLRLVSKIWNSEASKVCKRDFGVTVLQKDFQHEKFTQLLQANRLLNLDCLPFGSITVSLDGWKSSILHEIIKGHKKFSALHLKWRDTVESNPKSHHQLLGQLLSNPQLQGQLHTMEFGRTKNPRMFLRLTSATFKSNFNFPVLTQLTISGAIGDSSTLEYVILIINKSPNLQILILGAEIQSEFLIKIFEGTNLDHITDFQFDMSPAILPALDIFPALERLKATLVTMDTTLNENFTVPRQLVLEFSGGIKELEIFWNPQELNLNLLGFPACPHLTKLTIYHWGGHIGAFNFERLPSLKEISFYQDIITTDNFAFTSPHPGVEVFRFNYGIPHNNDLMILPPHFSRFMSHVTVQFPNISSMSLNWNITPDVMQLVLRKFPLLETLELNSRYGFAENIFTGTGTGLAGGVRNYWRNGFNWSHTPEGFVTLAHLKNLKHLRLQHGWNATEHPDYDFYPLTNRGIQEGLAKIPTLQSLRITWTPKLSVAVLQSSLSHLETVEVDINKDDRGSISPQTFQSFQMLWPQLKIRSMHHQACRSSWLSWFLGFIKTLLFLDGNDSE